MKKWMLGLALAVCVVVPASGDDAANAIVKKAIEAHGGKAALDKM